MIDIDIAQQLFPNPLTMVTQLCATAVLFFFVFKFLWEPARELMEKRSNAVHAKLSDAEVYLNQAKDKKDEAHREVSKAVNKSHEIINKAEDEAKSVRNEIIETAQKEADSKHTEKKCLVCDTADLFLVSESIQLGDGGHQHHRGGSCKGGRKQEQWQSHSRKNPINFQCL